MPNEAEKKPAIVGGSFRNVAGQGEHTKLHLTNQFCIADEQNASGNDQPKNTEARRQVASAQSVTYGRRDHTCWMDRDVSGPNMDDADYVRDVVDLFAAGRFASNKYQRGKLAGLAVSWCRHAGDDPMTSVEVYGPLVDDTGMYVVGWLDDSVPAYGWRSAETNTLYRVDIALIAHLAAEAAARGMLEVER